MKKEEKKPALLQRLFQRVVFNPFYKIRSYVDPVFNMLWPSYGDTLINEERGSRIDAVFIAVNTIASEISSTPVDIKQETENGKEKKNNSILYRLIGKRPNRKMSASNFWYACVFSYLVRGDAYALIKRDGNFVPSELILLDPGKVKPIEEEDDIYYVIDGYKTPIPSRNMLHFKQYTKDGLKGISPIMHNAQLMGAKLNQQNFSDNAMGKKPPMVFSGDLNEGQMQALSDSFTGQVNKGGIPYINGSDVQMHSFTIPPNEAQYIETSKYSDQKIYGIYRLPPTFAQEYEGGVRANAEQQALNLVKHTLTPHYKLIEEELDEKLFTESNKKSKTPLFVKFNVNGKLRGDIVTRFKVYHDMVLDGVMNADEVRQLEDMPKQPGGLGEKYYVQGAMIEKGTQPINNNEQE